MSTAADPDMRALADTVIGTGLALQQAGGARRARWLAGAFARLADRTCALGQQARRAIAESAGLSPEMADWALETALGPLTFEALAALEASPPAPHASAVRARPGRLCAVVLAGNVPIGAARAVGWPLLFGWPVLAKASSDDDALAKLLEPALAESDPTLADAYRAIRFESDDDARRAFLLAQADAVSVYGSDTTLAAIRAALPSTATFIGHGHGLGAAYVGRAALASRAGAIDAARALAVDTAAYDQRGCLSPHVAWVERGGAVGPDAFAELVHEELARLRTTLPRGPLPLASASAQLAWRGVGAIRGTLHEGDGHAVCFEEHGPLRIGPGYRNLQVIATDDLHQLSSALAPLGVHLKCLGIAGVRDPSTLLSALPARVAPRVCALGTMQMPEVDALADGLPSWAGLIRWTNLPQSV